MNSDVSSSNAVSPPIPSQAVGGHKADESEESGTVKVARAPCMPTQEEVD